MFNLHIDYPSFEEEVEIVNRTTSAEPPEVRPVGVAHEILSLQSLVRRVPAADYVVRYAVSLAQSTRPDHPRAPDFVRNYVSWGAGPRASQYLILGAKARAILDGRFAASVEDVRALAPSVLRHRVLTNFNAEADRVKPNGIVERLLETVEPEVGLRR
jgi:MoxR-like ATPase